MIKILIVEDNKKLGEELSDLLTRYGYETYKIKEFDSVMSECKAINPDLVLLDINLPYFDGFHFCRQIRETSDIPVIFITSRDSTSDEILAMTIGGDDYITKPFDNQVLLTHIIAVLKRYQKGFAMCEIIYCDDLSLNVSSNILQYKDSEIELSKTEQRLLALLMQNKGTVVSRIKLIEMLWNNDEFVDENTLSVNINRVRSKLGELGMENVIKTIHGQGYMIK